MVDEPQGEIYGGVVAAPAFREIARFALQYLEVPPDAPGDQGGRVDGGRRRLRPVARRAVPPGAVGGPA